LLRGMTAEYLLHRLFAVQRVTASWYMPRRRHGAILSAWGRALGPR
jgi:hypothetical protein